MLENGDRIAIGRQSVIKATLPHGEDAADLGVSGGQFALPAYVVRFLGVQPGKMSLFCALADGFIRVGLGVQ